MSSSLMGWNTLPHEIQVLVLNKASSTLCHGEYGNLKTISKYLLVCQFWNVEIRRLLVQYHSVKCLLTFASEPVAFKAIQRHIALDPPLERDEDAYEIDDARFELIYELHELLEDAIHRGYISCMKLLLENGASWHGGVVRGKTVYHLAVASGKQNRTEMLRLLDFYFYDELEMEDHERALTPLALAIATNDLIAVEQLILLGAEVRRAMIWDAFDGPLTHAINSNNVTLLKLLLASGEDPNVENATVDFHPTMLTLALRENKEDMIKLLLDSGSRVNTPEKMIQPLAVAVDRCSLDTIKDLINRGADVNFLHEFERTPLCLAVFRRDLSIIQLLLDHDAEVTQAVCREARRRSCHRVTTLLLERFVKKEEASLNFTLGRNKRLIWFHPISPGPQKIVKSLLEAGADISALGNIQQLIYDGI
ncbi:hypothetical protein GX50_05962 [[Emmonsia] crescens]|uniref:Uncharacterized protein n=1 Tax=[Emmonsia] crescens TaxID=73230 RepID=A0A2B7ZE37_9EURO|nr:hypothetical protein GX50_05962 [Emmonsia crescens]